MRKSGDLAESNMNADRDEDFNTRYGSFRGSQMAIERVKPIPRDTAQVNLVAHGAGRKPEEHHAGGRLHDSPLHARAAQRSSAPETDRFSRTRNWARRIFPSRKPIWKIRCGWLLHLIMSQPEYQLS